MMAKFLFLIFLTFLVNLKVGSAVICEYKVAEDGDYTCRIYNQNLLIEADISGDHVTEDLTDESVVELIVMDSTVQIFPNSFFDKFKNLLRVEIVESGMKTFGQPITNCESLAILWLDYNEITSIPAEIFSNCVNLFDLSLSGNQIDTIHVHAFVGLTKLRELTLQNNRLEVIDPQIFLPISSLTMLDLDNNLISNIDEKTFQLLPNLVELQFSNNSFTTWNETLLVNNQMLLHLTLEGIQISNFSDYAFSNLLKLETLIISGNLEMVPRLKNLPSLSWLTLDENKFTQFSLESLSNLPKLLELSLNGNLLGSINFTVAAGQVFPALESLSFNNNGIHTILGNIFESLPDLKFLFLSGNHLHVIRASSIKPHPLLEILDISNNHMIRIDREIFENVTKLELRGTDNFCFNEDILIDNNFDTEVEEILKDCFNIAITVQVNIFVMAVSVIASLLLEKI